MAYQMYEAKRIITVDDMERIAKAATSPADLIDLLPSYGIHLDFADHLSDLWRKDFDKVKDLALLREIQHRSDPIVKEFLTKKS